MALSARFHAARDRALRAVDRTFAETVRLSPMKDGKADPDRPQVTFEAPLRTGAGEESNVSGGASERWRSRIVAGKAELHIDRATYSGPTPAKDDRVRALSRPGEPVFEVLQVDDRSHTRLVLELGEV